MVDHRRMRNEAKACPWFDSVHIFRLRLLPRIHPLCNSLAVGLHITVLLAVQLHHNFLIEGFPRLVQQDAENFRVNVLLKFLIVVTSGKKT